MTNQVVQQLIDRAKKKDPDAVGAYLTSQVSGTVDGNKRVFYKVDSSEMMWSWCSDLRLLKKDNVMPTDMAITYFQKICTFFGDRPFEFLLNTQYLQSFGCFDKFLTAEQMLDTLAEYTNPYLKSLIIDTGNFIMTGKRQMPLVLLGAYVTQNNDHYRKAWQDGNYYVEPKEAPSIKRMFSYADFNGMSSSDFFNRWIQHKNGLSDMLNAHRMMFGF